MLQLALIASRVFKVSFHLLLCLCEKKKKKERERKKISSVPAGYITPPFGLALPSSSDPSSVSW
jgi:hypothetical protein